MRFGLLIPWFLCLASLQNPTTSRGTTSKQQQSKSATTKQPPSTTERGTENVPFVVRVIPTPRAQAETSQEAEDRKEKSANDRHLVNATYILGALGALQLLVFGYQAIQLRKTVKAATEQGEDTKRAIAETTRSATAIEEVAKHIEASIRTAVAQSESMKQSVAEATRLASAMEKISGDIALSVKAANEGVKAANASVIALRERTAQQMRAYLTVVVGSAFFQEQAKGIKFQGVPNLMNTGHTPAHNVRYTSKSAILPIPLPEDFDFPLSGEPVGSSVLGPQQTNQLLTLPVEDFCDEADVPNIKVGAGRALYTWGVVNYEDIFGEPHYTRFCQLLTWLPNGNVYGLFMSKHNEAT